MGDDERTLEALTHGMDKNFFERRKSSVNKALKERLGPAVSPYLIERFATGFNSMKAVCFNLYRACEYALAVTTGTFSRNIASLTRLCNDFARHASTPAPIRPIEGETGFPRKRPRFPIANGRFQRPFHRCRPLKLSSSTISREFSDARVLDPPYNIPKALYYTKQSTVSVPGELNLMAVTAWVHSHSGRAISVLAIPCTMRSICFW
ncbi:MAG: hypothetical protein ACRER2_09930 [Methylococcales bacterium]